MSIFTAILIRIARQVVESVIQTIMQQVNILQDAVTNPLKAMVQLVIGGVWTGDGATRFAEEMGSEVIPQLLSIGSVTTGFGSTVRRSVDIINQAEAKATQQAQQLYDVFNNIYR
jgi:hypothetical protein